MTDKLVASEVASEVASDTRIVDPSHGMRAAMFLGLTCGTFTPFALYLQNRDEFAIEFSEALVLFALTGGCVIALVACFAKICQSVIGRIRTSSLLFGLALLVWTQGNVLVWQYGILTGRAIPWSKQHVYGMIDSSLWVLVICVSVRWASVIYPLISNGANFFILLQVIICALLSMQDGSLSPRIVPAGESERFTFSSDRNVIVLLLDAFPSDLFQRGLDESPERATDYSGFIYYPDAVGGFPYTKPSVPFMLTGHQYDNSVEFEKFRKVNGTDSSLLKVLRDSGYRMHSHHTYMPNYGPAVFNTGPDSQETFRSRLDRVELDLPVLFDLTAARILPHWLKRPYLESLIELRPGRRDADSEHPDVNFINDLEQMSHVGSITPSFKLFHLHGMHLPFRLNEDLEYVEIPLSLEGGITQSRADLKIVDRFLATLKRIGIYDSAMVLLVSDHGLASPEVPSPTEQGNLGFVAPLIALKPPGADGPLKTSSLPVTLGDIPRTCADVLGLNIESPGNSLLSIMAPRAAVRRYLCYWVGSEQVKGEYLPEMTEYEVRGHSWKIDSWTRSGKIFAAGGQREDSYQVGGGGQPQSYLPGQRILMGKWASGSRYRDDAWAVVRIRGAAVGVQPAHLSLHLESPTRPLCLEVVVNPDESTDGFPPTLVLAVNGREVSSDLLPAPLRILVQLSDDLIPDSGNVRIRFEIRSDFQSGSAGSGTSPPGGSNFAARRDTPASVRAQAPDPLVWVGMVRLLEGVCAP